METALQAIKASLKWLKKRYPTRIVHKPNKFADTLTFIQELQKGKLYLKFEFMHMHAESALSASYTVSFKQGKKNPEQETYSLLDHPDNKALPGIDPSDLERLKPVSDYHLEKDRILADSAPEARAQAFADLFIKNYDTIVEYAKTKTKGK